jgi:SagB-type dehydrogenase family enzyme
MPSTVDGKCSRRAALAATLTAAGSLVWLPLRAQQQPTHDLPAAARRGGMALAEALATRRSQRRFSNQPLAIAALAQLLWAAQGESAPGRRTAPSAGALYPLETHVVVARVDGLAPGAYRYMVPAHALQRNASAATPAALRAAALGQACVGAAPAVVVLTAVESRSAGRYGARAARYAAFEAGAAAQNLALQAVALGLGTVVIGGFDDAAVARVLQLSAGEQPLALLPVGSGE